MEANSTHGFASINNEDESQAREYVKALRGIGRISGVVLYVYPFLLVFLIAFFIGDPLVLAGFLAIYWVMFFYMESARYRVDSHKRGVDASFRDYIIHSPFSQRYFKFSVIAMLIFFGELAGYYVHMTAYEGGAFLVAVICVMVITIYINPWLDREVKRSVPLESGSINARLLEITQREGIAPVQPRVIGGKDFKVANAYCVGIVRPIICITDYALENITEDEAVSILAHEISHLKRRDALKMTLPAVSIIAAICVLVAIVTYWSTDPGMIPLLQRIMPYMVQAWVYMALGGLFFIPGLIRMRGETMADRLSVDYSGSERIFEALIKLQHLNMIPVMVFNFNPGRSSLLLRIGRIRKYRR